MKFYSCLAENGEKKTFLPIVEDSPGLVLVTRSKISHAQESSLIHVADRVVNN